MRLVFKALTTAGLICAALLATPRTAAAQSEMAKYEACLAYADGWYQIGRYLGGTDYAIVLWYAATEECFAQI